MRPHIGVVPVSDDDPMRFEVTISDATGATRHQISINRQDLARLAVDADAESLIAAAFRFLLDREPKEAILASFNITAIGRYFPEFETKLQAYLDGKP